MKIFLSKVSVLLIIFLGFSITGCSMSGGGDDDADTTGTLRLQISNSISRALKPSISLTPSEFALSGTSDTGNNYSDILAGNAYTEEIELAPGVWTFSITANNAAGTQIGSGSTTATVTAGKTTNATIGVTELSGNGTLSLSVEWTAAEVADPGIGCYLQPYSGSPIPLHFTINETAGTATLNSSSIPAGYYTLFVKLQDGVNTIPGDGAGLTVDGTFESVRIVQGQTTSGSYAFTKTGSFTTVWKTDNDGVSGDDQISLPLIEAGTYDFIVSWGDGSQDHITSWTEWDAVDAPRTHTYASAGTYTVTMTGWIRGFSFYDQGFTAGAYFGDDHKLIEITNWGTLDFGIQTNGADGTDFSLCNGLVISATDIPNFEETKNLDRLFDRCYAISTIPNIDDWNTAGITSMASMFWGDSNFNDDVSDWDVSHVTNMSQMFGYAALFSQDLGSWVVSNVSNMTQMFISAGLSDAHYDALLTGWAALPTLQSNVTLDAGTSQYLSTAAATARQSIIDTYGWTISDGGQATP